MNKKEKMLFIINNIMITLLFVSIIVCSIESMDYVNAAKTMIGENPYIFTELFLITLLFMISVFCIWATFNILESRFTNQTLEKIAEKM